MEKLVIEGNVPLHGEIEVSGSKNAALPILMASILLDEAVTFHNVPRLRDIHTTLKLLGILGCESDFTSADSHTVRMEPCRLCPEAPLRAGQNHARFSAVPGTAAGPAGRGQGGPARRLRHRGPAREFAPHGPGKNGRGV